MADFVLKVYVILRRLVRSLVIRSPLVERRVAGRLLAMESVALSRWIGRGAPNPVMTNGYALWHRPEDMAVILPVVVHGEYEPETSRVFKEVLRQGMSVVDCGAHIGYFTLLASRAVGATGRVHAFEPVPGTFEILSKNIQANGHGGIVALIPKAVSDRSGRARIFLDRRSSVSAKLSHSHDRQDFRDVETISLDEYFRSAGWPRVDLVKMDIEGAEKAALEGMKGLSDRNPDLRLIIEVNHENLRRVSISLEKFVEALQGCGFTRFQVLWREGGYLELPRDVPRLAPLARRVNVNLLCEKR